MSEQVFALPDLGEGLTEATIVAWKVRVGDLVTIDQVIVEVETAKALVEVPVPFEGAVTTLHGREGDVLTVGEPLISVGAAQSTPPDGQSSLTSHTQYRDEERAGSGNVLIGYGTRESSPSRRRRDRTPAGRATDPGVAHQHPPGSGVVHRVISPVVRQLAAREGVDLACVHPTGAGGVIRRADIEQAIGSASTPSPADIADSEVIALQGLRKVVAEKLSASRREIPDATTWVDVDATQLLAARRVINTSLGEAGRISVLAMLARFTVAALRSFPELNSTVDTARGEITRYRHVHLGIATQTPRGLVVPVVADADLLTTEQLSAQLAQTTELARAGKLPPTRLTGGTFTLNNYGVFGVDGSAPIINHPEAAILGIGRIVDKPWVADGQLAIRKITQISLSFDHRVCDGGTAGGFLRLVGDLIENPITVLGRL